MDWNQRFVIFDCETTGLDPERDHLVSIGAVGVEAGEILIRDTFETLVQVPYNSAATVVHGITREESLSGLESHEAVRRFLMFAGGSTLVGHHIGFDLAIVGRIAQERLEVVLPSRGIDTMEFAIDLAKRGAFGPEERLRSFDLDGLCARFGIEPHDRHTAPGDAFLTAQVFLKLWRAARRIGVMPPHFQAEGAVS